MNYLEEQSNELEALGEIYYNEIKVISNKTPITFSISVRPQASTHQEYVPEDPDDREGTSSDDCSSEDEDHAQNLAQHLRVDLEFELPPKYPDEEPKIKVLDSCCLTEDDLTQLLNNLNERATESLGTVMVFTLVSDVVEWLSNKSDDDAVEQEVEREKQRELQREECKRFDGSPVTEANFLAWKAKFDAEQLKIKITQQKMLADQGVVNSNRQTGREMFESDKTLAESDLNFVEDLDQGQIEALMQNLDEFELEDSVDVMAEDYDDGDSDGDDDYDEEGTTSSDEDSREESTRRK